MNTGKEVLPHATVLLTLRDSAAVNISLTDEEGKYAFENIDLGDYLISVSMAGYETVWTDPFTILKGESFTHAPVILPEAAALSEIVIKGKKPLFELKQDRVVVNISASPAFSGNTGMELLQKTPGVMVNRQSNSITMNAKGEVLIMINNRMQRVPMEVLMAKLEGMRAENIEQIEIIHQPGAKYDASGAAGIIHIVLKENKAEGTNTDVSLIAGYGQRAKAGININLNSRKGKINWYGGYNFNLQMANNFKVNHFREYEYQGDTYYHENYVIFRNYSSIPHAANLGIDIAVSKRTTLGFLFTGTKSTEIWSKNAESKSYDYINNSIVEEQAFSLNPQNKIASLSANANLFQKTGTKSSLNVDVDYAKIRYHNATGLTGVNSGSATAADRISVLNFWITGINYTNDLGGNVKLEMGIKGTFNATTSTTTSKNFGISPNLFSGNDNIQERILAGYISLSKRFSEKLNGELGVRYEDYRYTLNSETGDDVAKAFKNPFPIFRLHYNIDSANAVQISFNRSVTRPSFFHFTSFLVILDSSLVVYANPRLRPAFTNTFKVMYSHKSVILSLAYLRRTGEIYFYNTVNKQIHLQTSVPTNLDLENIIEADLSFPVSLVKWWKMNWSLNGFYHTVKDESSHPLMFRNSIFTGFVQLNNSFRLGKGWTTSLDGRYQSWYLVGDQEQLNHPYLNLGIRKEFSDGNMLGVVGQDLTNSSGKRIWEYHQPELGIRTFGNNNFSERQVRVTYTHVFGNKKLTGKRERKTGAEEVKGRM